MNKKDLDNILKAELILKEERFSDTVKDMLKAVAISAQGGSKIEHKQLREDAVIAFEENTITAAFTNFIKTNPQDKFSGFIITFDKKKQGSGEMKKIASGRAKAGTVWGFIPKGIDKKTYSLQYTMSITEMMTLSETQNPKIAIGKAIAVFNIIAKQWQALNYTIQGTGTTKLTMVHSAAMSAPITPAPTPPAGGPTTPPPPPPPAPSPPLTP